MTETLLIAISYIRNKIGNFFVQILLMSFGITIAVSLLLFSNQMNQKIYQASLGIDAVIGAKGSPLQLILSTISHVDIPTGNIDYEDYQKLKKHPKIRSAIPISLGDSFLSFRIIGTNQKYLQHFNAKLKEGSFMKNPMEAVIGSKVAKSSGLKLGNVFVGNHGIVEDGHVHNESPYRVVGILQPTNSVLDQLIITPIKSVWQVHHSDVNKEITAILVKYKGRSAHMTMPRYINKNTNLLLASPAFEMARLNDLVGFGTKSLMIFGIILVAISLLSVFISMLNNIRERTYDLAILRILGASRRKIFFLTIAEGMIITFVSSIIGLLFGHLMIELIGYYSKINLTGFIFLPKIYLFLLIIFVISLIACIIPAIKAYKTSIRCLIKYS